MTATQGFALIFRLRLPPCLLQSALFVVVWALFQGFAPPARAAWDDPRATANPCANWQEDLRTRRRLTPDEQRIHGWPYLYDGVAKLSAPMSRPIMLSPEFSGSWKASCVIFEVMFSERNGELTIERETARVVYPPVRSDVIAQRQQFAAEVLRQIPFSHVIVNKPAPGTAYLVAVPLWPAHPFYTNHPDLVAGPVVGDLRDRGYSDAERIGGGDGIDVYKVFEQRSPRGKDLRVNFVVVRNLREDEPIVQIREVPGSLRTEQRPEGPVVEIFERLIAPWLRKQAESAPLSLRQIHAEVRHYARDFRVPYDSRNGEAGLGTVADHKTGQPVDHPLLVAYHSGNVVPGDGMVRWGHNLSQPRYANIGELKQLLAEAHLSKEERARRAREAREKIEQAQAAHDHKLDAQRQEVRRRLDANNPLASLGYSKATLLFKQEKVVYFLSEAASPHRPVAQRVVVAVHEIGENDPVVELVPAGGDGPYYHYAPSRVAFVQDRLVPAALARWPDLRTLEIHHHVRGIPLADTAEFRRMGARAFGFGYDQPLFEESYSQHQSTGPWRPLYETWSRPRLVDLKLSEYGRSVAEARALRAGLTEAQRVATLSPEQQRAELRAQRLKIQAERSPHYVYKSDYFWTSHPRFYIPQHVFDGNFGAFQINTQFPRHFSWFLEAYSANCEEYVQKPRMRRTIITQSVRTDRWGFVTSTGPEKRRDIYIEMRFWPKYEEYEKVLGAAVLKDFASILFSSNIDLSPQRMMEVGMERVNEVFALAVSWKRFFRENHCTSATVEQMRENMLRAANGQPSLQAAGIRVPNAASETEPLVPPRDKATIFDACYENNEYKKADFCMCMDTRARKVMSQKELKKYSGDFSLYYNEIVFPHKGGLQDPRWRLYDLLKQCSSS